MPKSIDDICIKIDKEQNNMEELRKIWDYMQEKQQFYAESEFDFIIEHLKETVKDLKGRMYLDKLMKD